MFLSNLKGIVLLVLALGVAAGVAGLPSACGLFMLTADARAAEHPRVVGKGQAPKNSPAKGPAAEAPTDDADNKVVGSGKPETKKYDLADFTALDVSSVFEVEVARADKFGVSVTADDNLLPLIKVEKKDAVLHLSLADKKSVQTKSPLLVTVAMPALKGVVLQGACSCTIKGFESNDDFTAKVGGASSLGGSVKAKRVKLEADGASTVKLQGSAKEATLSAEGASSLALRDFALDGAEVQLSGASNAVVNVKSKLDYHVSGASDLKYLGSPTIGKKESSGVSSVAPEKDEK